MLFHKRSLHIFITLFSQDKFKCLSVLSLLLFIYFFPKNSSSGAQSHSVFPSQCLLSLPRAAAPMEIGEHQKWGTPTPTDAAASHVPGEVPRRISVKREQQGSQHKESRRSQLRDTAGWVCSCRHCVFSSCSYRTLRLVKRQTLIIWPIENKTPHSKLFHCS